MTDDRDIDLDHADDAGDPAQAFEALRLSVEKLSRDVGGEMTVIRKGVEAAFEEFEKHQAPPDYGPDLGRIVQQLAQVGERLQAVEQSPILRQGPEYYAARLERGGRDMMEKAQQSFSRQAGDLERMTGNLAARVAGARERQQQDRWLCGLSAAGLVLGILLTLFAPRVLPFSAAPRVASVVMGDSAWRAGMGLMAFDSPEAWDRVAAADRLAIANKDELAACRETAARVKKDQRCTITVAMPAQP
jgi:hypothetical protein